jgi:hypothetical protein
VRAPQLPAQTGLQNHLSGGDPDAIASPMPQHPHPLPAPQLCIEKGFFELRKKKA